MGTLVGERSHNAIVLAVDGEGILHVAWAEHARALHYARGVRPGSLELGASVAMTGEHEAQVTYPQFYALKGGDLLFVYRDGRSGKGDIMLNRWAVRQHAWHVLAHPLISGEGARNAYVNTMAIDARGGDVARCGACRLAGRGDYARERRAMGTDV